MQTLKQPEFKITPTVKKEIVKIVDERIKEAHVRREDFSELKGIIKELGIKIGELAEAQKRTEIKVEELAEVQKRTEIEIAKLTKGLAETRGELGGLSKSMGYAFENEAFRMLPGILKEKYDIELQEKLIREEIREKEINIFGKGRRNGRGILIVGESKLRLDERREKKIKDVFTELEDKVKAVKEEYGDVEIVKILITHYATKGFMRKAKEKGIIVVQSFEW
jgi:phosphoenolpyruvate-protein kinase (PTS system EI component)